MKIYISTLQLLSKLSIIIIFILISISTTLVSDTWRGTAPFCAGECLSGETQIDSSSSGDGGYCWTGKKVLCRNNELSCSATQTKTSCWGFVTICDNGSYENAHSSVPVWKSCSKYACGPCFGLDF